VEVDSMVTLYYDRGETSERKDKLL